MAGSHADMTIVDLSAAASTGVKPGAKPASAAQPPIQLEPSSMDLALDETQELIIHAYPTSEGLHEDVIMCR